MIEEIKVGEIVKAFRLQLGGISRKAVGRAEFGALLVEGFSNIEITRQTIYNWEQGKREPEMKFLMSLYTYHFGKDTWQLRFAAECLKAMYPETFTSGIIELKLPPGTNHNGNK